MMSGYKLKRNATTLYYIYLIGMAPKKKKKKGKKKKKEYDPPVYQIPIY